MKNIAFQTGTLIFLLAFLATSAFGQGNIQPQTEVRVVVGKFFSDEMAGKRLEKDVPFLLNRSLLAYKGLVMVEDDRLANISVASKDYTQKTFRDAYQGLDFILYGDIASLKGGFVINAFLFDVKNNLIYDQKPVMGDNSSLFDMCSAISKAVSSKIYELTRMVADREITFAMISDAQMMINKKGSETDYLTDLLIRKAIKSLEYAEKFKVIPYEECVKFNGMPETEVAQYMKVNGIIHLKMIERKDFVKILIPTLYVKRVKNAPSFDMKISMPEIPSDYYKKISFNDFVINEIVSFANAIVTDDGTLRLDELTFTSDVPEEYIRQGDKYLEESQYFLSNYYYYKALNLAQEPAIRNNIYYKLGSNKVAEYRLTEAEEEFWKILENDPDNLQGMKGLGIIAMEKEDYADAYKKFDFIADQNPSEENIYFLLGMAQFQLGQYEEAIKTFHKDRSVNPGNTLSSQYIGLCYIQLHLYDNSINEFTKLLEQNPGNEDYRYYLSYSLAEKAIALYNSGNYSDAVNFLNQSNDIQPLNYTTNIMRLSLIRLGKYDAAANLIEEEILKKNYDRIDIYYRHALDVREVFLEKLDPEAGNEVIKNLMKSLQYEDNPLAYYYIGNAYIYLGQIDNGLEYLRKAHEKDPSNTSIHMDLMEAMLINNRFNDCIDFFNALNSAEKNYEVTEQYLALMDYLMISAKKLTGQDIRTYERELNRILGSGVKIENWSYEAYKAWLNAGDFREADKAFLRELTAKMEAAGGK